jgi:hypothetical protein
MLYLIKSISNQKQAKEDFDSKCSGGFDDEDNNFRKLQCKIREYQVKTILNGISQYYQ